MPSLRCSVLDAAGSCRQVDLDVSCPQGTTWDEVHPALVARAGLPAGTALRLDGRPVADEFVIGHPPLLNGALLVAGTDAQPPVRSRGVLELHVVGGPDSGRAHPLGPGMHRLGRAPDAEISISDAETSRWHAGVTVGAEGVTVRDLNSVNGTTVDDVPVGAEGLRIGAGQHVRLGGSTVVLRSPAVRLASTLATGNSTVDINRAPRPAPNVASVTLRRPPPPGDVPPVRWSWLALLLPFCVAVPIALVTGQPMFLLFALMSPVMIVANVITDRSRGRRDKEEALATWRLKTLEVERVTSEALAAELATRRQASPDAAELLRAATRPTSRLWHREPGSADVLELRLGTGRLVADLRVTDEHGEAAPQYLEDAPVVVALRSSDHLGIAGPRPLVLGVARHLVCQVAAWHSPHLVQLVFLLSDPEGAAQWAWARWLPHLHSCRMHCGRDEVQAAVQGLLHTVSERAEQSARWPGAHIVVVIDTASRLRSAAGLAELLVAGPAVGVHALCLDSDLAGLAGECRATFEVSAYAGRLVTGDVCLDTVRWDGVRAGWAEQVARALAGLRDATPISGVAQLPDDVRLLDLLDVDATDPRAVLHGWETCAATTAAVIGVDSEGVASVDLRRDGPHVLVAGTTGAGKSELLQTLVAALAVANRPDEMSFVLVDYKGGAAFSGCAELPHTSGVVTDLDEHLAARALTSLGAELTRREKALKSLHCKDIEAYHAARAADPAMPPLGRLVVVIDEFRLLAEELPGFISGLVRLAAVGRSLGVHLVLATQRPAGIVSADIKANVNLRIALRVRDRADSDDVVEAPDAARIDAATPGRALCRTGSGPLRTVQVARISGAKSTDDADSVHVRLAGEPEAETVVGTLGDDLAALANGLQEATRLGGVVPAPAAWLPPLPRKLTSTSLPGPALDGGVALGLVDLPDEQSQPVLRWHPARDGHLGLSGGPRSGRTSAVLSVALALAAFRSPSDLHLQVIDAASGQLRALRDLPHTGSVLTRDQPRLVARLITRLADEVQARLASTAGAGQHTVDPPRHHSPGHIASSVDSFPPLVLLIDGWDALAESLDGLDHGRSTEALIALLRDGRAAGLRAVVSGDRALLTSRLAAVVPDRLLLRVTDPTDLLLAGLPSTSLAADPPPGRAVRTSDGASVQLAAPPVDAAAAVTDAAAQAATAWSAPCHRPALRVRELPSAVLFDAAVVGALGAGIPSAGMSERVGADTSAAAAVSTRRPDGTPVRGPTWLGLGGDDGTPAAIDLSTDPIVLVAGPPGSGRSTALATIGHGVLHAGGRVIAVCPRPSPLDAGPWPVLGALDHDALENGLTPGTCVLVDDAELVAEGRLDAVLHELVRQRGPTAVVLAATTSALLSAFRGALAAARSSRTGVLLQPSAASDGDVLGIRARLGDRTGPGRGLLVVRGEQSALQVGQWAP